MTKFREKEDEERLGCPRMCKTKFQHCSGKGWSVFDLYQEIGETKDFASTLSPTENERERFFELFDPEAEYDLIDVAVDSWTTRLKEGRSVWFKDLCEADIRGREEEAKSAKPSKPVLESSTPKQTAGASESGERSIRSVVDELNEVKEIMSDAFVGFTKKIEEIGLRQEEIGQRQDEIDLRQKEIVVRLEDIDTRFMEAEGLIVQLSATVGKEPMIIPPAPTHSDPTHTDNTSVGETKEKKRTKRKKEHKADNEVLEDITPELEDKEKGETKAPEKKRTKRKKEHKADNEVLEDITPELEDKEKEETKAPEKGKKKPKSKRLSQV